MLICLPCMASLQDEYEKTQFEEFTKPATFAKMLLYDDYEGYQNGGESLYGRASQLLKAYKTKNLGNDIKYINIFLANYKSSNPVRITVGDTIYKTLQAETKKYIAFNNRIVDLFQSKLVK